jgi:YVTN family beta-propeller protein
MQIAMSRREGSKVSPLASTVLALNALAFGMASPAGAFTAYVSNEKGNSITIIDTGKMEVTKTVQVGHRPRGIALSQDGSELFICAGDDDLIQILDTKKLSIIGTLPSARIPSF